MAGQALSINGRLVAGETLQAWVVGDITGLQWQALVGGTWVNVGIANSTTYTIPAVGAGTAYRLVGSSPDGTFYSLATGTVSVDSKKASAPVLSGPELAGLGTEGSGFGSVFSWLTLTDVDRTHYGGGSLLLQNSNALIHGGDGEDVLSIRFLGTGAGQFSYNEVTREVRYAATVNKPVVIGTLDATLDGAGTDLRITFNANATVAVVDALINNLQLANDDDSPAPNRLLTLRITDGSGASAQRVTSLNIENTPDAPIFSGSAVFTVDENQVAAGTLSATDPDKEAGQPQGITYSLVAGGGSADNALLEIDGVTGALRFRSAPDYEDAGHSPTYTVRVRATDSEGSVADQVVAVTVRDANDAPVAFDAVAYTQEEAGPIAIALNFNDADAGDSHTATLDTTGTVGSVSLAGTTVTYDDAGQFQHLGAYRSAIDTFTFTITDAAGLSVTRTLAVRVQGRNDAAAITGTSDGSVQEDAGVSFGQVTTGGQLTVTDPDDGENGLVPTADQGSAGLGSFVVNSNGQWTYRVANSQLQSLSANESVVDTLVVTSFDGTASAELRVTVSGVNDSPVLGTGQNAYLGLVVEAADLGEGGSDAGISVANGTLTASDADSGDTLAWSGGGAGQYGSLSVDAASGAWTYTLDNASAQVNALRAGDVVVDTFMATATDSQGASVSRSINITVQGRNDAPVFTGGDTAATVVESAPDGKLALSPEEVSGIFGITVDSQGRLLVMGQSSDPWGQAILRLNADGSIDTSFGSGGSAYVEQGYGFSQVAVDGAGRIVAAGTIYNSNSTTASGFDFGAARYLEDGSLDTSFGDGGRVVIDFAGGYDTVAQILFDASGRMLLAGSVQAEPESGNDLAVVRLNDDGSLDTSFGNNGKWVFTMPGELTASYQVALDGQGRMLVWGNAQNGETLAPEIHLARYLADGTIDASFGVDGHSVFSLGTWYANKGVALAIDAEDGFVLAWNEFDYATGHHVALSRFDSTGAIDSAFGNGGTAQTGLVTPYGSSLDLALDGAGRIVVAPQDVAPNASMLNFKVARFNADGSVDASFGQGGLVTTDVGGWEDRGEHLLVGADGSLLLAGHSLVGGVYGESIALVRYHGDGSLDTHFGGPSDAQASGWLGGSDPDVVMSSPMWSGSAEGMYGNFTIDAWGGWQYRLDNSRPQTQGLQEGESVTDRFVATLTDEHGLAVTQEVVVTVIGVYDPPAV